MVKPTSVHYARGVTLKIGDGFEFVRIDMSADGTLDAGETIEAGVEVLKEQVDDLLRAEVKVIREKQARMLEKRGQRDG